MIDSTAELTISILAIDAQMQARERAAYEREVDASIARGLAQARDHTSKKRSLDEMHAHVSQTIARVAKGVASA